VKYKIFGKSEWGSDIIEFLCHELSIEYDFVEIGDNFKSDEAILNVNPLGRVPMVETPHGECLIESLAIVYHLTEGKSHLVPDTKNGMTYFHQIMAFMSSSIYPAILLYFHPDHYVSNENTNDLIYRSKSIIETYLNYLENKIGEYIVGTSISAADFYLFTLLFWLEEDHFLDNYPKIQNYYNKMLQNQTIMKVRKIQNERKTV
jgi:glutathione S-transferase